MSNLVEYAELLESTDEAERIDAAEDIGYLNSAEGVPALVGRLSREPSRVVREAIFHALIRIDAEEAIEGSMELLASDDPQIRNQAVDVLRHKGTRSIGRLSVAMRDGDRDLRKLVLDVLTEFEVRAAAGIYTAALRDPDVNVVITAVENLGKSRAAEFRSQIEDLLHADSHPMLMGACLEALGGIGNELSCAVIRRCFPDLTALPDFILGLCLKALGAVGAAREFADAADLLAVRGPHLRSAILGALTDIHRRHPLTAPATSCLPALQAVAEHDESALCRYQAVRTLGFVASRDDICLFLISCLSSSERLVRLAATKALRRTQRPDAEEALAALSFEETDEEILQALLF
jgi:HEAT repeat protein